MVNKIFKRVIAATLIVFAMSFMATIAIASDLSAYKQEKIAEYTERIKANPNDQWAYFYRGCAYGYLKDYNQAIDDFNKASQIRPGWILPYLKRGDAYFVLKNYDKAIEDFTKYIQGDPNDSFGYGLRGLAYVALKNYDQAISDFDMNIQKNGYNSFIYYYRGLCHQILGDTARTNADFAKFKELYDKDVKEDFETADDDPIAQELGYDKNASELFK